MNIVDRNFQEHAKVISLLRENLSEDVKNLGNFLGQILKDGGTIFWAGNGGSAADSQHLAAELVGRFKKDRVPLKSVALTTDTSVLTCIANDYSYNEIFSRQIEALGTNLDVLIAISTSGQSENLYRAIQEAKNIGMVTIALIGKDGGKIKNISDHSLIVNSNSTARIQEAHILIGHTFCDLIEESLGLN